MEYPLISEYKEAIFSAEDNFNELASLRPVLDSHGDPVMSSGNFAVVFKMRDEHDGKLYAVKCFIKDQDGRDESYRKIADELETVSSSYILPLRYLEKELFVDNDHCQEDEFPIVVMEWVEGETLDAYLNRNLQDKYELEMLSYLFNRMAAWLLAQPFAHGDLKPDNILVRKDGSLVLVDYDGMFVPSMKGEKAREIGSPDYQHPLRTVEDFDEHIDDFSIAVIALTLRGIALNSTMKHVDYSTDSLLFKEKDFQNISESSILKEIVSLSSDEILRILLCAFFLAHAKKKLDMLSFRLFLTEKPQRPIVRTQNLLYKELIDTKVNEEDYLNGREDEFGVLYSADGTRLLKCCPSLELTNYSIKQGVKTIVDGAFYSCSTLQTISIPDSIISIGENAFFMCESLYNVFIPESVISIGNYAFRWCKSLRNVSLPKSLTSICGNPFSNCHQLSLTIASQSRFFFIEGFLIDNKGKLISCLNNSPNPTIPDSVNAIGDMAFIMCEHLLSIKLPNSVNHVGNSAFYGCKSMKYISVPKTIMTLGENPFGGCFDLKLIISQESVFNYINGLLITKDGRLISCLSHSEFIIIPDTVSTIGGGAFEECKTLREVIIPETVTSIEHDAFVWCNSLEHVTIPDSVISIGEQAFWGCDSLKTIILPNPDVLVHNFSFPMNCNVIRLKT